MVLLNFHIFRFNCCSCWNENMRRKKRK